MTKTNPSDFYLSKGENKVLRPEVGEPLVQGGEKADLRHVLNAQLLQQGIFPEDNLRQRRREMYEVLLDPTWCGWKIVRILFLTNLMLPAICTARQGLRVCTSCGHTATRIRRS